MQTTKFTDTAGREWDLQLSVATLRRLNRETDFEIRADMQNLAKLAGDLETFAGALVAILRPQLEESGVSIDEFYEALGGAELQAASDALVEAALQFLPADKSAVIRAGYERAQAFQAEACAELTRRIESFDVEALFREAEAAPVTAA